MVRYAGEVFSRNHYTPSFKAPGTTNGSSQKLFKTNLMPEDVAFISSKSGVNTLGDSKVMSAARKTADRQTAFCLYIYYVCVHLMGCFP